MAASLNNKAASMSMAVLNPGRFQEVGNSLHSASVHITDYSESVNPQPWESSGNEERSREGGMIQDYLSPVKLIQLSGEPDLRRITSLELTVNTMENSLGNFGGHLPNLVELRFTDSTIPCIRDLGTGLSSLKILWMSHCKLKDLDGLPALCSLCEFYLAFNNVEDVSVVTMLSLLDVLDLECNDLSEEDQLGYLALCQSLTSLTLEGNPLSAMLAECTGGVSGYRDAVHKAVPGIKVLDDLPFDSKLDCVDKKEKLASRSSLFALSEAGMEKDWHILKHTIKEGLEGLVDESQTCAPAASSRPKTAPSRRTISLSPLPPPSITIDESGSELTHGLSQVICGNPVRALRARKQHGLHSKSVTVGTHSITPPPPSEEWKLDSISEDIAVTRTKSEENLCPDEIQQPAHLLLPKRLPTPPKAPLSSFTRPKSVADFRQRRYRKLSSEDRSFSKKDDT